MVLVVGVPSSQVPPTGETTTSPTEEAKIASKRAAQRVGEDQGAGHERDAEHDRERAHQQAHLAPEQGLPGSLEHQPRVPARSPAA